MTNGKDLIFELHNVIVEYKMKLFSLKANNQVSINIERGKITALVGESGSGKTTLASTLLNAVTEPGEIVGGEVIFHSKDGYSLDVSKLKGEELRKYRWEKTSMVFQGSQSALNPVMTIYAQFKETMREHNRKCTKEDILNKARDVLSIVNLDADRILKMYPHELSGGMKQRVMIAFALLLDPEMIILDEPTTALDVITQDYIFKILKKINKDMGISMLLLTHDIGIVSKYADNLGVMYGGKIVEFGDTLTVFEKQYHPYTKGLIKATPSLIVDVKDVSSLPGNPPNLLKMPEGCIFHPRCGYCLSNCSHQVPSFIEVEENHFVLCNLYSKEEQHE